MGLINFLLEMP